MILRYTNTALLALTTVLTLTGLYGLVFALQGWAFELHRWAGWALVALVPWKAMISARSLRRGFGPSFDRSFGILASVLLTLLIVLVGGMATFWMWRLEPEHLTVLGLRDTLISWHWMIGLLLLPLFGLHSWRSWPRPRRADFVSRRGFLYSLGLAAAGGVGWLGGEALARARQTVERRFTGSREHNSFEGNSFPVTSMARDGEQPIDPASWALQLRGGAVRPLQLDYQSLLALPQHELVATLDCTVGWFSDQRWRGVRLMEVLRQAGLEQPPALLRLEAQEGYSHLFTPADTVEILLATHVSGETLAHRHGYPLRAVVPSRRGWFWVKWLTRVEVVA